MKKEHILVISFWLMIGSMGLNLATDKPALGATPILQVFQGGTGSSTLSGILLGNGTSSVRTVTIGTNLTLSNGTLSASITGGTGDPFPFTSQSYGVSTSTVVNFTAGLMAGTSTFTGATTTFTGDMLLDSHTNIFTVHNIQAHASDGIFFRALNGSNIALFGAGGGQNATFYNGTSITGVLAANGGLTFTNATGTGIYASASSTFQVLNAGTLKMPSLTLGGIGVDSTGLFYKYATTTFSTGLTYANGNVTCDVASGSQAGCLSTADWTAFNAKQYSFSTSTLSATAPLTGSFIQVGSGGSLGCQTASGAQAGCLSSSDWTTFNGKQATISTTWPITLSGATVGWGGLGTSTTPTAGHIAFWNSSSLLSSVATGTISANYPASVSATRYAIGGDVAISVATSSSFAVALSSTSTMGTGTTTIPFGSYLGGATFSSMGCNGRGGGTFTAVIGDGTASSSYVVSGTGLTTTFTTLSSNNVFTSGELIFLAFGSVSGTVGYPSCSFLRN